MAGLNLADEIPAEDARRLIHELRVHQVELEMQNEQLRTVQTELEESRTRYADLYDFAPIGYLTLDENGRILNANLAAANQLGTERARLLKKIIHSFVPEGDVEESRLHLARVFQTRERQTCELRLKPRGGEQFYARLESIFIVDVYGRCQCRTSISDISRSKIAEQALRQAHDELERRVAERTAELQASNRTLVEYSNKLEWLNEELQEFAFVASHDLQEPLRKIQTFGKILISKHVESLNPTGRDYMGRIIKAANRMSELLRSLLAYSRSGASILDYKPVSLTGVARDAASDLELLISRAKGRVEIDELPIVEADAALLRQVFQNLIENSIKYRKESEPPTVKIYGDIVNGVCRVVIEDNGIGFDECYCQKVFKPFERLHGRSSPYTGIGMGLAICRKIIARHGGEITVHSMPGKGAAFTIQLPIEQKKGT